MLYKKYANCCAQVEKQKSIWLNEIFQYFIHLNHIFSNSTFCLFDLVVSIYKLYI